MADNQIVTENTETLFSWGAAIRETLNDISQQLVSYAPQVIGAAALLLIGWGIAKALSLSAQKLIQSLDSLFARVNRSTDFNQEKIKHSYAKIISKTVYWIVMIFFLAVAANILGWDLFSGWLEELFAYLPGIITGMLIILGGFLLSNLAKTAIITAAHKAGIQQSQVMAKVIQIAIICGAIIIGVEQIGLNIGFLSNIIVAVIAILLAGAVLAFSLGAKDLVANIIGAQYFRKHCEAGDHLKIADTEGEIIEVSQASIVIENANGKSIIPAKYFHEYVSHIRTRQ
tara:strand:- start:53859 stop:54716 length:858 start_codon:yes stop_codon:yes gene_type:complete